MTQGSDDRENLIRAIERAVAGHSEVAVAYLYGSRAAGGATPLSDVDVAVLPREGLGGRARTALQRRLLESLATALPGATVDVRLFDELPLAVRGRVLRDGLRVVDRDPVRRVRVEVRTRMAYHDFLYFERAGTAQWVTAVRERLGHG